MEVREVVRKYFSKVCGSPILIFACENNFDKKIVSKILLSLP
jgi:hypothetical protein